MPSDKPIPGGSPSAPVRLNNLSNYIISNDSFYNHFVYSGVKGEKIFIHAHLNIPLNDRDNARCSGSPTSYQTQIHVRNPGFDRLDGVCGEDLIYTLPEDGDYIFQAEFPHREGGALQFTSVLGDADASSPAGRLGSASHPKEVKFGHLNELFVNTFFNYFSAELKEGDKVIIDARLNSSLSSLQLSRCAASSEYKTGINVYDSRFNRVGRKCGERIEFSAPATGRYIFHFDFSHQSAGYFNAAVIRR